MYWLVVSLIAPFIWSLMNHLDKFIISKYSKETSIGALSSLSAVFAGLVLPFIFIFQPEILDQSVFVILLLILTGICTAAGILFYLHALERDDASHIVPFWFMIPVLSYFLGVIFLSESLTILKILGSMVTLVGAMILSLEFDQKFRVKHITALLMLSSSLFLSFSNVIFKLIAIDYSFWSSIFWNQAGVFIFGIGLIVFIKKYRQDFIKIILSSDHRLTYANIIGEIMQVMAEITLYYAITLAPVSLVLLISYSFQPTLVILEGILITIFLPGLVNEKITKKHLIQKLLAVGIMIIGVIQIML